MSQTQTSRLILASASPRRVELMREAGYIFDIVVPDVEEAHDESLSCEELTVENAKLKALTVAARHPESTIVAADTLVYLEGKPIGKPADMGEAADMLRRLSGRTHEVCTGVAIASEGGRTLNCFHVISDVVFKPLSDDVIAEYHRRIQPLDKAGGYAIQDESAMIIERISGSWSNVKGLPMERLLRELDPSPATA